MVLPVASAAAAEPTVDLSAYRADSGITVSHEGQQLRVLVAAGSGTGQLDLDLRPGQPLIRTIGNRPRMPVSSRTH